MDARGLILALSLIGCVVTYMATSSTAHQYNYEPDGNKQFYVANLADGVGAVSVSTGGDAGGQSVAVASPSMLLTSSRVGVHKNPKEVSYSVTGAGSTFSAKTAETKLGYHNLIVTTKTPSGDKVEAHTLPSRVAPTLDVVIDGPINGVSTFDVYVATDGSTLESAKSLGTYSSFGDVMDLPDGTIKPGFEYTLFITKSGTKQIVSKTAVQSGMQTGWCRLHAFTHKSGELVQTKFDVDAWRS